MATAQQELNKWLAQVSKLNISESERDLLDLLLVHSVDLNRITQQAERELQK